MAASSLPFLQDLGYAVRGLRSRPGFVFAVVLTLALGIGANSAMFSVVDRLLFRPPPLLRDPALVHRVYLGGTDRGKVFHVRTIQYARYVDLTSWTTSFTRSAAFSGRKLAIGLGADAREMQVGVVTAGFFSFFDAPPALGRYFTATEDSPPQGTAVAVLSYGFWQTRFGGRPDALGQTLQVGATLYTIVGVAPRGFVGVWAAEPPAVYVPVTVFGSELATGLGFGGVSWWSTYQWRWAGMLVGRKPGVTVAAADADLTGAYARSYQAESARNPGKTPIEIERPFAVAASILDERGPTPSGASRVATWLSGVALMVWLIACANVANLFLARALRRRREIAVRLALGVSRARLAAQLFTESVLLALLGGGAGVLVAEWGGAVLRAQLLPTTAEAAVVSDPRTLIFAGCVALLAGVLTGLAPVFQARGIDLTRDLKTGVREGGGHRSRTRVVLLVAQAALSVVLLVGAGLFVRSLRNVRETPMGFDPDSVLSVELQMRGVALDSAASLALLDRLLQEAPTIPGVVHASRELTTPFWSEWETGLYVDGVDSVERLGEFLLNAVSPDHFATMGTRILRGRGIDDQDGAGAPGAMVVSDAMGRALWPGKNPIGQCVRVDADSMPCTYVVGVAANIKARSLSDDTGLYYYLSAAQFHPNDGGLFLRVRGDPAQLRETIRRRLQQAMPGASYVTVTPIAEFLSPETQSWRLGATMFSVFGLLALVLAAIGLYSVIAYNVTQRAHELGVRAALGAQARDLLRLILVEGMRVALTGILLGTTIAFVVAPYVKPLLFEESPRDPAVFLAVGIVLLVVAALACLVPARRAGRVDPMQALRSE